MIDKSELDRAFDERFPLKIKEKLFNAHVAIAGLGGLGSNIALMLARSGVGHLLLVDFDIVDVTNLNRQAYRIEHIGMEKTKALKLMIEEINPYLDVRVMSTKVDERNALELFSGYEIVCEAFDMPDQKAMLVSSILTNYKHTIVVSGNGMAGFEDANLIRTEKKMSRLYVAGDGTSDISAGMGLMAPRVMVCAGHQANKVLELILV